MAIFNNSNGASSSDSASTTTIITAGTKIKGELELSCNLYIDGELDGMVKSNKEVNIGKNGRIKGSVKTDKLIVQGYVEGTVDANRVEIKAAGHISGEVTSMELVIESQGLFEGNSIMKTSKPAAITKA